MSDILEQCKTYCGGGKCMSGDTCAPMMHDEPCYGEIADEFLRLRAEVAEKDAEIERLREVIFLYVDPMDVRPEHQDTVNNASLSEKDDRDGYEARYKT